MKAGIDVTGVQNIKSGQRERRSIFRPQGSGPKQIDFVSWLKRSALLGIISLLPLSANAQTTEPLIAGANINMVSGTEWPGGDQFLQRQNEPSLAVSTRNPLHLLAGANDYRSVDIPGLTGGKAVGDSWHGIFTSVNGGGSWVSTLLPGYPQQGYAASPLYGYEAGADPVIRAGTNGLFYYSGIVFDRGEGGKSATFISRFMDLNNDPRTPESFADGPIRYIDTKIIASDPGANDPDNPSQGFIDKPWIAVDIPRPEVSQLRTLSVPWQDGGYVDQTIECGPLYSAYAQITGEDTADIDSHIMFSASYDCGETFTDPIELDNLVPGVADKTVNQGTSVAIDPTSGDVYVSWRQFNNITLSCTRGSDFWERHPKVWPVQRFMVGGVLYDQSQALGIMAGSQNGNPWRLARELIVAKLNIIAGASKDADIVVNKIDEADALLIDSGWVYEGGGGGNGNGKNKDKDKGKDKGNEKEKVNSSPFYPLTVFFEEYNTGDGEIGPGNCDNFDIGADDLPGTGAPDAIIAVRSTDFGKTFSAPITVSELVPFDQGTTLFTFRANSYPTMTVDDSGRVYFAWSTRKLPDEAEEFDDSRVVISTFSSTDNWFDPLSWAHPEAIDPRPIDEQISDERGHQIQPTLTFSRGKLMLVYLDFRQDRAGVFERYIADYFVPDPDPDPNADDSEVPQYRHTVDVRAAQALASDNPAFSAGESVFNSDQSAQLSRYFNLLLPNDQYDPSNPNSLEQRREQIQYNPLNQPLFKGGTVPFIGDYIDVAASPAFIPDGEGGWAYDTALGDSPVFHTAWSDNRDVKGPPDGDWTNYIPPTQGGPSVFDPDAYEVQACVPGEPDRSGMRNQNIYTSRITNGIYAAIPENTKPLFSAESGMTTSFVVLIKYSNNTLVQGADRTRTFKVTLPDHLSGGQVAASFNQFDFSENNKSRIITIGDNSSSAITVFVTAEGGPPTGSYAPLDVVIESTDGALRSTARINPDPSNPQPRLSTEKFQAALVKGDSLDKYFMPETFDGDLVRREDGSFIVFHDLDSDDPTLISGGTSLSGDQLDYLNAALLQLSLSNPDVFNPGIYNPGIYNPGIYNPGIYNPGIYNPGIYNPGIYNPGIYNPGIYNPGIYNPGIYNPGIYNSTITDANYIIENEGEAAASYSVNLRLDNPDIDNYSYQLIVSKISTTPVAENCAIVETPVQEVLVNNTNPVLDGNILGTGSADSFYLVPGEFAIVTLRAIPKLPPADPNQPPPPPTPPATFDDLSVGIVPDAVDEDLVFIGETQPPPSVDPSDTVKAFPLVISAAALPDATGGIAYSESFTATGGANNPASQTWRLAPGSSLPLGLKISESGELSGIPLEGGTFGFNVRVVDPTGLAELGFTIVTTEPADLILSGLGVVPVTPISGEALVGVYATVTNNGEEPAAASTGEFTVQGDGTSVSQTFNVPALTAGQAHTVNWAPGSFAAGDYTLVVTTDPDNDVIESNDNNNLATHDFTVYEPLLISAPVFPDGTVGEGYPDQQLASSGGSGVKSYTLVSGTLPTALLLSSSGLISGTPATAGTFAFTVGVEDDYFSGEIALSITIDPAPVTTASEVNWTISGAGITSATETAAEQWSISYSIDPAGFSVRTWTVTSSPVPSAGDYTVDWSYSGLHAWFAVTAFLNASDGTVLVNAGPQNCCTTPSNGFSYAGTHTFTGLLAGDTVSFTMGGKNGDFNNFLNGTLTLKPQVKTAALGGAGGPPIALDCPANTVAVGIKGSASDDITATQLVCRDVVSLNPASLGAENNSGLVFLPGGVDYGAALTCGSGTPVLTGVSAAVHASGWVDTLASSCSAFDGSAVTLSATVGTASGPPASSLDCPAGYAVVGLRGSVAAPPFVLQQVQLICKAFDFQ